MQSQPTAPASTRTPAILGTLALGAGLAAPLTGEAALIITDINFSMSADGDDYYLDLNKDSVSDYIIKFFDIENVRAYVAVYDKGSTTGVSASYSRLFFLGMLSAGAQVDTTWFNGTNGNASNYGFLFYDAEGLWNAVGAHGYVGLRLGNGDGTYNYGWLEATRGSVTLGRAGYQTTADEAAEIPGVPVPGTLALLVSGAAGLGALRRRQRTLAAA